MTAPALPAPDPTAEPSGPLSSLVRDRLDKTAAFYDEHPTELNALSRGYRGLLAHYYRHLIPPTASVLEIGCGAGDLLALLPNQDVAGVDVSSAQIERARVKVPRGQFWVGAGETLASGGRTYDFVILSETLNFAADVQTLLQRVHAVSTPATRLLCNFYSSLWRPTLAAAVSLGLKARAPQSNWLSADDVRNLCDLADWQMLKTSSRLLCPGAGPGARAAAQPLRRALAAVDVHHGLRHRPAAAPRGTAGKAAACRSSCPRATNPAISRTPSCAPRAWARTRN